MNILALILHLKTVIGLGNDISKIAKDLFESKKLPSEDDLKALIEDLVSLVTGGVLNVFSPDEAQKVVAVLDILKSGVIPVANDVVAVVGDVEKKSPVKPDLLQLVTDLEGLLESGEVHEFVEQGISDQIKSALEALKAGLSS